ncbi:MAG: AI-2E family transporter, partial [Lachnospiraceae bacterium]|nr:AI-2E family transporter [Lachnospiraceae bacterium]
MGNRRIYLKVLVNLGIMLALLLTCIFIVPRFIVCFMPFIIGWVISLIASPFVRFFEKQLKIKRKAGAAFVIISVIALVILAGYLLGAKLVEETSNFVSELPEMWESTLEDFEDVGKTLEAAGRYLPESLQSAIEKVTANIEIWMGEFFSGLSEPT